MFPFRKFVGAVVFVLISGAGLPALAQSFGPFAGENGHVTKGTATIVQEGDTFFVQLNDDFRFDGAPDPRLALGNGQADAATATTFLTAYDGAQRYALPAGINPADYTTLHVWCAEFSVSLGVAPLN